MDRASLLGFRRLALPSVVALVFLAFTRGASAQHQIARFDGNATAERLGNVVVGVGDVDGDGFADVAAAGIDSNVVRVFSPATATELHSWSFGSGTRVDALSVTGAGDLDGDGIPDVVVGDRAANYNHGLIYAYSGGTGGLIWSVEGPGQEDELGADVAPLGDIDGDGTVDLLASATGYFYWIPYIAVLSGRDGSEINRYSDNWGDHYVDVDGLGDVDGDLVPDFLACSEWNGEIDVVSGATCTKLFWIPMIHGAEHFGENACSIADVNGDGVRDILAGVRGHDAGTGTDETGAVYVFSGAMRKLLYKQVGASAQGQFGDSVADAGDVDLDGTSDYLVGAPADPNGGYVDVYSGRTRELLYRFRGDVDDRFGHAVAATADADGDGMREVVVSAPLSDVGGTGTGSVRVHAGNDLFLQVDPPVAVANDFVTLTAAEGPVGALALIALVDVNGSPTFLALGGLGVFDSTLRYSIAGTVPPGLAGNSLSFRAWGDDASGRLRSSEAATLTLQ